MREVAVSGDQIGAALVAAGLLHEVAAAPRAIFHFECHDAKGNLKWTDTITNVVTTEGKNAILATMFGATAKASWFVGLKGAGAAAVGDTAATHAAWAEVHTQYSEGARPAYAPGTAASGSLNNSASKAVFTFTGSATVAGAFLISNSTKGGTTGTLYNAGDFSASRTVAAGDTLSVTVTLTIA
jgi:hypothetical protein